MSGIHKALRVVPTNSLYKSLCEEVRRSVSRASRGFFQIDAATPWSRLTFNRGEEYLVVCSLSDIDPAKVNTQRADHTSLYVFVEDLPPEAIAERIQSIPRRAKFHLDNEGQYNRRVNVVRRIVNGRFASRFTPIVDAWIEYSGTGYFVALSHDMSTMRIPLADLQRFIGSDQDKISNYEIDEDGSFVYWPHADAHFGWRQLQNFVDPASVAAAKSEEAVYRRSFGSAMRLVREQRKLSQQDIAGFTNRHIRRFESGTLFPKKKALESLAAAHGLSLAEYLHEIAQAMQPT